MLKKPNAITLKVNELRYNIIMTDKDKDDAIILSILLVCLTAICILMTIFVSIVAAYKWIAEML